MAKKKLKTIEEHNYERRLAYEDRKNSGLACPKCGEELEYPDNYVTMSVPPKRQVQCKSRECNYNGFVVK